MRTFYLAAVFAMTAGCGPLHTALVPTKENLAYWDNVYGNAPGTSEKLLTGKSEILDQHQAEQGATLLAALSAMPFEQRMNYLQQSGEPYDVAYPLSLGIEKRAQGREAEAVTLFQQSVQADKRHQAERRQQGVKNFLSRLGAGLQAEVDAANRQAEIDAAANRMTHCTSRVAGNVVHTNCQ